MTISTLVDHNLSLTEIEDMMPWELQVYVALLETKLKEKEEAMRRSSQGRL
jgi:hypothetical protein